MKPLPKTSVRTYLIDLLKGFDSAFKKRPYIFTFAILIVCLLLLQRNFVFSGDIWAEAYGEYVEGAISQGFQNFFHTGIAGYYNFFPKLITYPYVVNGLPLEYIDHFFRITVITFGVGCMSFAAHAYNRNTIKNDYLRLFFAVMTLFTYYHVSTFNLINVWYVTFVPIILVSINSKPFRDMSEWRQVAYAFFAIAACMTKPSVVLLPFVIYRAWRHREYLLGSILTGAIVLQYLLFITSPYYANLDPPHVDFIKQAVNIVLQHGLLFLKTFNLPPLSLGLLLICFGIFLGLLYVIRLSKGWIMAGIIGIGSLLSTYTYVYSPDNLPWSVRLAYKELYNENTKLQRELLVSFFFLLMIFMALDYASRIYKSKQWRGYRISSLLFVPLFMLSVVQWRPIDTQSSNIFVDIDPFRKSLGMKQKTCMPIPPTPSWVGYDYNNEPTGSWYFQFLGVCKASNYDKAIDRSSFKDKIGAGKYIKFSVDREESIKALLVPIVNDEPRVAHSLILTNSDTGKIYKAIIKGKSNNEALSFASFNLADEPGNKKIHTYKLTEKNSKDGQLKTGFFIGGGTAYYSYMMNDGDFKTIWNTL